MNHLFAIALAAVASLGGPTPVLSIPDLSGTWVLQIAESDFGMIPAPESRTDVIAHQEPHLSVQRTTTAQGATTVAEMTYAVDGQPHRNTAGGTELVSVLQWDGEVLVMVTTIQSAQGELTITDRYSLSADGATLTQARSLSIQGQDLAQHMVLKKQ